MEQKCLLFTKSVSDAQAEIESLNGRITHVLSNTLIVGILPETADITILKNSSAELPDDLDDDSKMIASAWHGVEEKNRQNSPSPSECLSWDTQGYSAPGKIEGNSSKKTVTDDAIEESTGTPTSLYMIGSVAVGIIIVGGAGQLSFSNVERQKVIQEAQEGLDFLVNAEPRANLKFVYDIKYIEVDVLPGDTGDYETAEAPWRNAALKKMGYSGNRQGSIDYVQQLRISKNTQWSYVAYFTKYSLHHFAYAVYEKLCMEYSNDGWGIDAINRVFAHESCHIFGAADEYGSCSCGEKFGYLGVPNNNCIACPAGHVACLMDANVLSLCQWTRGQIGWSDSLFPAPDSSIPASEIG